MSEISVTKTLRKRFLLLLICQCCATLLVIYGYVDGILGPRGLGIAGFVLFAGFMVMAVLLARKSQKGALTTAPPPGTPIDEATRKQRLRTIRSGKMAIAFLAVGLVFSLFQDFPVWALLVAALFNLSFIAIMLRIIVRLRKSLD